MVLEEQQRLVDVRAQRRLLLVLDEAATVASLDELDQMASTVSGLDVTLVTVLQDFSQLKAVGSSGLDHCEQSHDPFGLGRSGRSTASQFLPELFETRKDAPPLVPLRQRPPGTGTVIAGHRPAFSVRLQPWWRIGAFASEGA